MIVYRVLHTTVNQLLIGSGNEGRGAAMEEK